MSALAIRAALQVALAAITPSVAIAWENEPYKPVVGTPYQRVNLLFATPDNSEIGPNYVEHGFLQVTLAYPIDGGAQLAAGRADLLRSTFKRGFTFVYGGVTVLIEKTAQLWPAQIDGDRYSLPVRIPFRASVTA